MIRTETILDLDAFCRERDVELIPSLASFGHLASVLHHQAAEVRRGRGSLLVGVG